MHSSNFAKLIYFGDICFFLKDECNDCKSVFNLKMVGGKFVQRTFFIERELTIYRSQTERAKTFPIVESRPKLS